MNGTIEAGCATDVSVCPVPTEVLADGCGILSDQRCTAARQPYSAQGTSERAVTSCGRGVHVSQRVAPVCGRDASDAGCLMPCSPGRRSDLAARCSEQYVGNWCWTSAGYGAVTVNAELLLVGNRDFLKLDMAVCRAWSRALALEMPEMHLQDPLVARELAAHQAACGNAIPARQNAPRSAASTKTMFTKTASPALFPVQRRGPCKCATPRGKL